MILSQVSGKNTKTLYKNNLKLESNLQIIPHLQRNHESLKAWYSKSLWQQFFPHEAHK